MFLAIVALASIGWAMEGGPTPADGLLQDTPAAGAAQAVAAPDELLLGSGPPDRQAVEQLVGRFGSRDPLVREAAIRRLTPYPEAARAAVVKAFRDGNLATRLAALDLLGQWRAPVAGLDPWRPETISPAALAELEKWLSQQPGAPAAHPAVLSREELEEARREIDRLLRGPPEEAAARREQLARWGAALLPEVYARLRQAEGDEDRRRLLALRYRLVASGSLVLRWPGGLERLASNDTAQRQKAAEELAGQAAAEDQPLLLELFSDPDPLVREISLRGVQAIGGASATAALVRLLDDPEPNVRAAVLKQLAEEPSRAMVPKIAEYLTREKDADLVVHAIRFLKAAAGPEAVKSLLAVLDHPQWQVRAEAAEALGGLVEKDDVPESLKADAYVALIRKLDDPDGFVVSRALDGLGSADLEMAVEPMLRAAAAHPELAGRLIELSVSNGNLRAKALPKLREFTRHGNATVRAAAIRNLCGVMPDAMPDVIAAGLGDPESRVRTAAAWALNQMLAREHPAIRSDAERFGPFTRTWISSDGPLPESVEKWIQAARAAEPQASGGWRYRPEAAPAESSPERPSQVGDVPAAGQPAPLDADYAPAADQPPATEPPPAADQPPTTAPLPAADRPAPSPVLGPPGMGRSAFAVMPSYDPP